MFHVKHLHADNISVRYRERTALSDASASFAPGTVSAIIGPNGSGKSTLLRSLAGVLTPSKGEIRLDGYPLRTIRSRELSKHLTYVPQDNTMPFDFTVGELVALSGASPARIDAALKAMDIISLVRRSVVTLSGGERQRAAIARAIAQNTQYLLLDEPTAHLDLQHQALLTQFARERAVQDGAVILILHDINLAAAAADRLLLLHNGSILADGTPTDVLTLPNLQTAYQMTARLETDPQTGRPYLLPPLSPNGRLS
jgi:iron complex transport system ATP-binding protein